MQPKNLISVVVDRLHAGMVGAYGNYWIRTRRLDRLACESFVFDQALVDNPELARIYRGYWLGTPGSAAEDSGDGSSLPQLLAATGVHTTLVTDTREVAALPLAGHFAETILIEPAVADRAVDDVSATALAALFKAASNWLATARQPFCLWVHARGMAGDWDAPWELRRQYADEEDPEPPRFIMPPEMRLSDDYDPDVLLGITHAYAGQVSALDACLDALCDAVDESDAGATTLLTLLSARGFPLGEHGRVGPCDEPLYNEIVQIPWLMRFPDRRGALARSPALVRPADLPGTLLDWLGLDRRNLGSGRAGSLLKIVDGLSESIRDRMLLVSRRDQALRTPAWHLRMSEESGTELYAKPADRWEVNEVSGLLNEIVTGLQAAATELGQAGEPDSLPPLDVALVTEVD